MPPARSNRTPKQTPSLRRSPAKPDQRLEILRAPLLAQLPWLVHGFSTRPGGVSTCYGGRTLNLGFTQDDGRENVERNRARFLEELGAQSEDGRTWPLAQMKQIHSCVVHHIPARQNRLGPALSVAEGWGTRLGGMRQPLVGDGLITSAAGLLLAVRTADCVPVLVADVKQRAVGAFHAGWRGTMARVVEKGVGEMRQLGSLPGDLRAVIGPSIRRCCYQVGPEVQAEFESQFSYAGELFEEVFDTNALEVRYPLLFLSQRAPGHGGPGVEIRLDLVEANRRQLHDTGIREEHINILAGCTACNRARFFSHRAEAGRTGRMMAVIGIKPE